jgi:hypothetical protein
MSLTASASLEFVAPKSKSSNLAVSASQTLGSPSFSPSLSDMPSINNLFNPLDVSSVKLVKLKKGLKTKFSETALFNYLVNSIRCAPHYETLKQDLELVLQIYSMIEVITTDSKVKIDKLAMIIAVYSAVFAMSDTDKLYLVNIINYMNDSEAFVYNGKSLPRKVYIYLRQLFSKPALPHSG